MNRARRGDGTATPDGRDGSGGSWATGFMTGSFRHEPRRRRDQNFAKVLPEAIGFDAERATRPRELERANLYLSLMAQALPSRCVKWTGAKPSPTGDPRLTGANAALHASAEAPFRLSPAANLVDARKGARAPQAKAARFHVSRHWTLGFWAAQGRQGSRRLPQALARRAAGLGRARRRRSVVVRLRPRRGVPGARRAHRARRLPRAATAGTVFIISYGYSRIIEHFPSGGGGYVVATQAARPARRRRLRRGAARRLRAHDHDLDRLRRRRDLQLHAAESVALATSCPSRFAGVGAA